MLQWYYIIIVSGVFMGVSTVVEKYALKAEHATTYTAAFTIIAALAALVLTPFSTFNFGIATLAIIYVASLLVAASYILIAKVYRHGNISVSSALTNSMPSLFVVLLSFVFLGERLKDLQYASIAVMILASYVFLTRYNRDQTDAKGRGVRYADTLIAASLVTAVGYVIVKYLLNSGISPITYVLLSQIFVAFNMLIYMAVRFGGVKEISHNIKRNAGPLVAIGVMTVAYRVPLYISLSATEASVAVPVLNAIFIIVTVMIGGFLFKEGNIMKKLALSAVLVAASYFLVL
ncbi:MAG: DMT family transporter [Candidatus Micrarchaeota archaeon]|nr:DMT family transporter [Candidatus Micrarchaeota archaeon]